MEPAAGPAVHDETTRREAAREHFGRAVIPFEFVTPPRAPYRDKVSCRMLPGLGLADITCCSEASTRRTARHLNDTLSFSLNLSGEWTLRQRGREHMLEPGEATLIDGAEVSSSAFRTSRFVVFGVPRKAIAASVPNLDDKVVRLIRRDCEALRLLAGYAGMLRDGPELATPEASRLAVTHVYDLIALALGASRDAAENAAAHGVRAARLQSALAEIAANFARPSFSAHDVAQKLGLSPRYLQELLHAAGSTFTERVLELRLRKAHTDLSHPLQARSVAEIALDCGFSDLSYFNRRFRCRFGDTPSGVRGMARRHH